MRRVPSTARRSSPKLPINEHAKRLYPQSNNIRNINPFRLKQTNSRIKGGTSDITRNSAQRTFPFLCGQKDGRSYKDPKTRQVCTATDAHYHLRVACVQAVEPSFVPCSLVIPEGMPLTECRESYITKEFSPRVY